MFQVKCRPCSWKNIWFLNFWNVGCWNDSKARTWVIQYTFFDSQSVIRPVFQRSMDPDSGRFELSKGRLRSKQAVTLGFETRTLKCWIRGFTRTDRGRIDYRRMMQWSGKFERSLCISTIMIPLESMGHHGRWFWLPPKALTFSLAGKVYMRNLLGWLETRLAQITLTWLNMA